MSGTLTPGSPPANPNQANNEADGLANHADRVAATADQHAADGDERASARDRAAAGRDDRHVPRDADSELAYVSCAKRGDGTASGQASIAAALGRTPAAFQHDEAARLGDVRALARDRATDARDRAAERNEAALEGSEVPVAGVAALREAAAQLRTSAAEDRARAAADRATAADDRAIATADRAMAADDRAMALADRDRSLADRGRALEDRARAADDRRHARTDLQEAYHDELTGVYTRGFGLLKMQDEIDRAHRTTEPFVLAFIDVDGLKASNDARGHAAGDNILRALGSELGTMVRSYDPVVRVGGDEFICAFSNTTPQAAADRVNAIKAVLRKTQESCSISVGLAQLRPDENLEDLTTRADTELYRSKNNI